MNTRDALLGDRSPRIRVGVLALSLPVLATIVFFLEYDVVLGFWPLYLALGIALYAGLIRGGALAGLGTVFIAILWRFVVPPLVGYLRWSMDTRYTPPRLLAYKLDPPGELQEGLVRGPLYALIGAFVLGGLAYLAGVGLRKVVLED